MTIYSFSFAFFLKKIEKHIAELKIIPTFATANEKQRMQSECSAVGSALRSGRRGRAFESPHSDRKDLIRND